MNSERWRAAYARSPRRERRASNARFNGHAPSVWTVSIVGSASSAPSETASWSAVDARAGERAAADLDDEPVERDAGGDELPAERLAALDGEPVQVALAGERQRAGRERLVEARGRSGRRERPAAAGRS